MTSYTGTIEERGDSQAAADVNQLGEDDGVVQAEDAEKAVGFRDFGSDI